ncbi:hypothetical protein [Halobacteriovorax sp.]|uniref:COG1470 family protein n=1 Tax=Halobacteriovorax sp. TaxID=2020862 RepID=UPI003AF2AEEE
MKFINTSLLFLSLLLHTLVSASSLDISMLPDKTVSPGEISIQVLPFKSRNDANYDIEFESNQQWRTEGPTNANLKAGELNYLTFYTYTPSFADAGLIHELNIVFRDTMTGEEIKTSLSFVIAKKQNLDFYNPDRNLTTNKKNYRLNLKIKNTGNARETYQFSIENLTPDVAINISKAPIEIDANESKLIPVQVNFKNQTSTYAAFIIKARTNGSITRFEKKFQVKFVNSANNQDRQGNYLDTTLTITNDYMSIDGKDSNLSSVILNSNGALSDYVSLSSYIQANMVNGQYSDARGTFHFDGDKWRFSAGENVDLDIDTNIGNDTRDGFAYTRNILPNLQVGTLIGVNEDDELNTAAMIQYDPLPGQRTFVMINQNTDTGETSGSIGYRGVFNPNDKLSFAPSLTIADDPQRGVIQDYRTALNYMVRKNLPIAITSGYKNDRFQEVIYNNAGLSYNFEGVLFELERSDELINDHFETGSGQRELRNSNNIRISFPMGSGLESSLNYQDIKSSEKSEKRKFITFSMRNKKLYAALRAGVADVTYSDDAIYQGQSYSNEPFITVNVSYQTPKITLSGSLEYESFGENSYQTRSNIGAHFDISNRYFNGSAYIRAGHEQGQRKDYVTQTQTDLDYIEAGLRTDTNNDFTLEVYARAENDNYYDEVDYQVGIRFQYRFGAKTPRRVEDAFGGKKTGEIIGRICIDENQNQKCEEDEDGVADLNIYSVTGSAVTDKNGNYKISELKPDIDHISLIERQVTAKSLISKVYNKGIKVIKNSQVRVDFALEQISTFKVFSYIDINRNDAYDKDLDSFMNNVEYRLISSTGEIIAASGIGIYTTNYSKLKNGRYKLIATVNDSSYEEVQREIILNFPEDNMAVKSIAYEVIEATDLSQDESILTDFDSNILSAPNYEAILNIDTSLTQLTRLESISIKINDTPIETQIEEFYPGNWSVKVDLRSIRNELKRDNKIQIKAKFSNSEMQQVVVKRERSLYFVQ